MIDDSWVWKEKLVRDRGGLKRRLRAAAEDEDALEKALVSLESFVFLTGYILRKLAEARKLSDQLERSVMRVTAYPRTHSSYPLDFMNAHRIDRAYDFNSGRQKTLAFRDICNVLVHSFVFMATTDEDGRTATGFLVNSDRLKNVELYFVDLDDFFSLVSQVASDDIVYLHNDRVTGKVVKLRAMPGDHGFAPGLLNAPR